MYQWKGLLKKEWVSMISWFYGVLGISILVVFIIPFGSSLFYGGLSPFELSILTNIVWVSLSILIPTVILLISFGKEMQRPDILLHSTASILKLLSVKIVFAALVGALNMFIPIMLLLIQSRFSAFPLDLGFKVAFQMASLLAFAFYATAILIMCTGLFFGVLYQVIKPVVGGFALPIVIVLFLCSSWVAEKVTTTALYMKIGEIGPVVGLKEGAIDLGEWRLFFDIEEIYFHTGNLLMDILLTIILLITAAALLEKKVRL